MRQQHNGTLAIGDCGAQMIRSDDTINLLLKTLQLPKPGSTQFEDAQTQLVQTIASKLCSLFFEKIRKTDFEITFRDFAQPAI